MQKERILVTVKTYPTLSAKHLETVCTAGVREGGSWVRLYPVPFRLLTEQEQYRKYDWLECQLTRHASDPRPESFRPVDHTELEPVGRIKTDDKWRERRRILLDRARVYDRLEEVIAAAKANEISLCVFRPKEVEDFTWDADDREWDKTRLQKALAKQRQLALFDDNSWRETFEVVRKLPFSFFYHFKDATGKPSKLKILDWEIGALYWNCLKSARGDESVALAKVREKYFDTFLKTDLHFFLGTTQQWHYVAPNPWVIVGVLPIPHDNQLRLF